MRPFRNPELMAIPIALVVLGVGIGLLAASAAGAWAFVLFGLGLFILLAALGVRFMRRHRHPSDLQAPETTARTDDGEAFRVVVVCDTRSASSKLADELETHADGRPIEALVVAPALGSKLAQWTGDDSGRAEAEERLDATVGALVAAGISARGTVGSQDPIQAADDALREFAAHELVFALHPADRSNWLEDDVVESARDRYDLPVRHLVVGDDD